MAGHVFPWHKKEHLQGDASHRAQAALAHLSTKQRDVVAKVESTIKVAGKGAQAGRRLLSVEEPPSTPPAADAAALPPDTSPSCGNWAGQGECVSNSGYMLSACPTSCKSVANPEVCAKWATGGRCKDVSHFMAVVCATACGFADPPSPAPTGAAAAADAVATPDADEEGGAYTPLKPFEEGPVQLTEGEFTQMLRENSVVMVNFYAPWCFWSNRLTPAWTGVARRLHKRAWSQSAKYIKIDCTNPKTQPLCKSQAIHAFPSVRIYRGSAHAFEPYEFGREENVMWLHLVKTVRRRRAPPRAAARPSPARPHTNCMPTHTRAHTRPHAPSPHTL